MNYLTSIYLALQCPEKTSYHSCISTCPLKSCQNLHNYKTLTSFCGEEPCVEGCLPDTCENPNAVYASSADFNCTMPAQCKLACKIEGALYFEGQVIEADDCNAW